VTQVIYGIHPVTEAIKSSHLEIEKLLIGTQKPHPSLQRIIDLAAARRIPVTMTDRRTLEGLAKGGLHQNIVAVARGIAYAQVGDLLGRWKSEGGSAFFLILDSIQDPQNFGALIRTALGCGVQGIIIPKDRAVGVTPVVVKASAGATAHLPIARVVNLATTIEALKEEGIWVYGASGEAKEVIYDLDLNMDLAIVVGSEGKGIRPLVQKKCDRLFAIPMKGPVSSFNASVSGAMVLYEVMRQRDRRQSKRP
jgi:23S rRNA (guanosine2251-2'-O)-methyltransferase